MKKYFADHVLMTALILRQQYFAKHVNILTHYVIHVQNCTLDKRYAKIMKSVQILKNSIKHNQELRTFNYFLMNICIGISYMYKSLQYYSIVEWVLNGNLIRFKFACNFRNRFIKIYRCNSFFLKIKRSVTCLRFVSFYLMDILNE